MLQQSRTDSRDSQWWFQGLESILQVYDREEKRCRARRRPVRRIEQSGRSAVWGKLPTIDGASGEDEFSEQ